MGTGFPLHIERLMKLRQQASERLGQTAMSGFMLNKERDQCLAWQQADQALLNYLGEKGFLDLVPVCNEIDGLGDESYSFSQGPGRPWIAIASDGLGDVWWPVGFGEDHEGAALARVFVLLHEAGHGVANRLQAPFLDVIDLGKRATEALNTWRLGPWACGHPNRVRSVFHECMADCWAIAVLLEITAHDARSLTLARSVKKWRQENSRRDEIAWIRGPHHSQTSFGGTHHTHQAIRLLLECRTTWKGQSAEVILESVRACASRALMAWIDPARRRPDGLMQREGAMREMAGPDRFDLGRALLWRVLCQHQDPASWRVKDHPALALTDKVWPQVTIDLRLEDRIHWAGELARLEQPRLRQREHGSELVRLRQIGLQAARTLNDGEHEIAQEAYRIRRQDLLNNLERVFRKSAQNSANRHSDP